MRLKELALLWGVISACGSSADAAPVIAPHGNPPSLRLQFRAQPNIADVHKFFAEFAKAQSLTFDDLGARVPSKAASPVLFLSLTKEKSIEITVTNAPNSDRYFVGMYEPQPDPSFDKIAAQLVTDLRQKWPSVRPHNDR